MDEQPPAPRLPDGVDDEDYRHLRGLMRASVLSVWRGRNEVIAGVDPWDVVDEAWTSMAHSGFESKGPFIPHAMVVARNKAVDALRRGEARRRDRPMDVSPHPIGDAPGTDLHERLPGSPGAEAEYLQSVDQLAAIRRLAFAEEAIYSADVLTRVERHVFVAVRVDGKSRAAVGRELDPPLTGQRVGQIAAQALIKVQAFVKTQEGMMSDDPGTLGEVK